MAYRKPLFDHQQVKSVKSRTSFFEKEHNKNTTTTARIALTKDENNCNNNKLPEHHQQQQQQQQYGTLDSAYETGSSAYNTVDSTYKSHHLACGDSPILAATNLSPQAKVRRCQQQQQPGEAAVGAGAAQSNCVRNNNNNKSSSEAATEALKSPSSTRRSSSGKKNSSSSNDMSYIPSYIRPVVANPNDHLYPASDQQQQPSRQRQKASKDNNNRSSQRVTTTPKPESKLALREKYVKRQQELQLSGRKSLKERLQSLETDADVKLQVNLTARRRPEKKVKIPAPVVVSPPPSCNDGDARPTTTTQTSTDDLPVAAPQSCEIKSATDVGIAEKEPAEAELDDATDSHATAAIPATDAETVANHRHQDDKGDDDETLHLIYDTQDCKVKPAAIKWKAVKKLPIPTPPISTTELDSLQQQQEDRVLADDAVTSLRAGKEENNNKLLQWKKLSPSPQPQAEDPSSDNNNNSGDIIIPVSAPATTSTANIALPLPLHLETANNLSEKARVEERTTTTTSPVRGDESKIATRRNLVLRNNKIPALTIDIQTANSVVPVELRSPRCATANCNNDSDRTNMREKRSARVFHLPSTAPTSDDDGDSNRGEPPSPNESHENLSDKYQGGGGVGGQHVAPVKFIPSVLRRNYSQRRNRLDHENSQSSSASSLVVACSNSNNQLTVSPRPSRRDSSHSRNKSDGMIQTPPTSEEARTAVCKDVKRTKHQHQRRSRSVTSRASLAKDHHHNSKHHHHDKKEEEGSARKHHHHHSRSRDRHDANEAVFIGRIKLSGYDDEEDEEEDDKKVATTPYRDRRRYDEQYSASSPRSQQYVADAVKFGYPSSLNQAFGSDGDVNVESEIPFIDETAVIDQQRVNSTSNGDDDEDESVDRLKQKNDPQPRKNQDERICLKSLQLPTSPTSNMKRSTSAESILSTTNEQPGMVASNPATNVLLRKRSNRSFSVDRHNNKTVLRRSYISAIEKHSPPPSTSKPLSSSAGRSPARSRHFSTRRKKDSESSQIEQSVGSRKTSSPAAVDTSRKVSTTSDVIRDGYLFFKVATIDKGKRTSAQKSWKYVNALLKNHFIFLCKETKSMEAALANEESRGRSRRVSSAYQQHQSTANTQQQQQQQQQQQEAHKYSILDDEKPLNLIGSLVSIAYNYVKRKNVFRLTTGNGSEYLFQAKDNEDMLGWITAIQQQSGKTMDGEYNINKELILKKSSQMESTGPKPEKRNLPKKRSPKPSRHNLHAPPSKDVDGSKRFKWRGSVNKIARKFGQGNARMCGHAFGSHLEDCPSSPNNELIPFVVELCCRLVEERGLWAKGIYRVPGNTGTCNTLIEDLNQKGPDGIDVEVDTRFKEVNVISSLLKNYFRTLPDPLFTNELYKNFITTNRKPDTDDRLNGLRRLVHMLPGPHYETLKYLIQHLRRVADNAEENKMDVRNLAIVFGPTLVRTTATDNMTSMVTDMSDQCRIVESILQNVEWFFSESALGDEERIRPVPVPTDTSQDQIIPSINHLLVNVGRTNNAGSNKEATGDSDSTSESSKSKHSTTSEKESFSRDVINTLFGKRWKNVMMTSSSAASGGKKEEGGETADNSSSKNDDEDDDGGDGEDDEFGFKQLEKRRTKKKDDADDKEEAGSESTTENTVVAPASARAYRRHLSQPDDVPSSSSHPHYSSSDVPLPQTPPILPASKSYRFHAASHNRGLPGSDSGGGDYSSRFAVFCNEQLERLDNHQHQQQRHHHHHHPQHQIVSSSSSSATERSSPLLPPRRYHHHQSPAPRRQFTATSKPTTTISKPPLSSSSRTNFRTNQQTYMYGDAPQNRRFSKDPRYEHNMVPFVLVPSSPIQPAPNQPTSVQPTSSKPQQAIDAEAATTVSTTTVSTSVGGGESDSETSLSMGETIEEKLKNLTNLDKKFERRPSRRIRDVADFLTPVFLPSAKAPAAPRLKKLSAPAQQAAAAAAANHHPVAELLRHNQQQPDSRKTTLDLYQERKEMRKLQRDLVKASRAGANSRKHPLGGAAGHRNSIIRCASEENVFSDVSGAAARPTEAPPLSRKSSKIRRRHTLGGSDVADGDDDGGGVTATNQPPTAPNTTEMKRRHPVVTSSAGFRAGRKTESYL